MKADFVAIDFELANNHRASAVEIGLSRGNPNGVLTTFSSLIRPPLGLRRVPTKERENSGESPLPKSGTRLTGKKYGPKSRTLSASRHW